MKDLHARRPADKKAAIVVGPGFHFKPAHIPEHENQASERPIPTTPRPRAVTDRTGIRADRLTVVGFFAHKGNKANGPGEHRWVVRCDCGRYAVRKWCAINRPGGGLKACAMCNFAEQEKRKERQRLTGEYE